MHCPAQPSWPAHPACERMGFNFSSLCELQVSVTACVWAYQAVIFLPASFHMFFFWVCVCVHTCFSVCTHMCLRKATSVCDPLLLSFSLVKGGIITDFHDLNPGPSLPSQPTCVCVCVYIYICVYVFVCTHYNCFPWPPARTLLCGLPRSACLDNSGAHVGWNMAAALVCSGELSYGMCA